MTRDGWRIVFLLAGLGNLGNGLWMLADPYGWYAGLPAAVPDFGPYNEHFVRDIGCTFAALGLLLLWGAAVPAVRLPALAAAALFSAMHALVHVYDTARGFVAPAHWAIDLPAVYAPTVLLLALTVVLARRGRPA
jgi:hypothetical protein